MFHFSPFFWSILAFLMFFCDLGQGDHMSFAYIGKDFYLVASPKGGSLSKSGGKKSSGTARAGDELQNLLYPSCPESCSSRRAKEEWKKKKQKRKVIVPSALQVLGETASSRAWNSHLHFQSPTERYPTHLSSTKMDQAQAMSVLPELLDSEQIFDLSTHVILSIPGPGAWVLWSP